MASSVNRDKQLVNSETIHRKITRKTFRKHCQVDTLEDTWLILPADLNLKDPQLIPSSRSQYLTTPLPDRDVLRNVSQKSQRQCTVYQLKSEMKTIY